MGITVGQAAPTIDIPVENQLGERARGGLRYLARNRQLILGLTLLGLLALFVILPTTRSERTVRAATSWR
jgi:hypothetical protein